MCDASQCNGVRARSWFMECGHLGRARMSAKETSHDWCVAAMRVRSGIPVRTGRKRLTTQSVNLIFPLR